MDSDRQSGGAMDPNSPIIGGSVDPQNSRNDTDWVRTAGLGADDSPPDVQPMSAEEIEKLGAEKGMAGVAKVKADQSGQPGPQAHADPSELAGEEGGRRGELLREEAERYDDTQQAPADTWQKYDWA